VVVSQLKGKLVLSLSMSAIVFLVVAFSFVNASQIESYQIGPGQIQVVSFNLSSGEKFTGSVAITGGSGNDVNFWVTDPQGTTILNQGRVSQGTTFEFTSQSSGAYTLHFDNSFSLLSSKVAVLTYDVTTPTPTTGGNDLGLLLTVIGLVVILLFLVVALVVALHLKNRTAKTNELPTPPPPSPPQQP
jgi:hypothetical protein